MAAPISWRREHWFLAGTVVSVIVMAGAVLPNWAAAMRETNAALPPTTLDVPLPALSPDDSALSAAIDAAIAVGDDGSNNVLDVCADMRSAL